jgi:NAD(P)-dependent dehydrogenase (short-subunit alcohol dehydrogenase family)
MEELAVDIRSTSSSADLWPSFAGKRAIVTGAGGSIGGAVMREIIGLGGDVVGVDAVASADRSMIEFDLSRTDALEGLVEEATGRLGGLDVLVNCAGTARTESVEELSWAAYDHTLRVNLHAAVFLMKHASARMRASGYGRIVNITSTHGRATNPRHSSYAISKAALDGATRSFAIELGGEGVLVNAVAPGFVATGMNPIDKLTSSWFRTTFVDSGMIPQQRYAEPEEVARLVVYLASEANTYVNGQSITVDGGLTIRVPSTALWPLDSTGEGPDTATAVR